jgi:hypothetical protein
VKKIIMLSRVFSNKLRGDSNGTKLQGNAWEDQILKIDNYSLSRIKADAGFNMKASGGRL